MTVGVSYEAEKKVTVRVGYGAEKKVTAGRRRAGNGRQDGYRTKKVTNVTGGNTPPVQKDNGGYKWIMRRKSYISPTTGIMMD